MSEDLFLTFQSQLSVVMETILKSAMFEITRLVEDSFLEEVGRRKQEMEVLRRRLQLSESKLRERERGKGKRIPGSNCGQTGASRDRNDRHDRQSQETVQGVDTLSINLSLLREQSTSGFPLTEEVWSSRQQTDSVTVTQSYSRKKNNAHKESATEITTPNSNTQIPQEVLQRLLSSTAVLSEPSGGFKSRENVLEKCEKDLTLNNEMDSDQSRLLQSPFPQDVYEDLASSPKSKVKSEAELDLLPVKEEEEMVPVWDSINRDDGCHEEMVDRSDGELTGSCDQEEIQVDSFPGLNSLDMQDASSYFTPYSVNTLIHQSIKPQHLCTTELALSSIPEESDSLVQQENGQNCTDPDGSENSAPYSHDDVCSGEKIIRHIQYSKHFFQDKRGIHEKVHAERSHHCTLCGRTFMKACDLRAHMMIHKGKKPLSCPHCDQTFAYNFELKVHQRHHSGERPHVCTDCGKGFARLSNFKQHQNIHTREKLFSCTQCGMRFNRATNLRVHLRRHSHAGKTYNCPQCGKGFLGPRQMKAHLLKFHGRGGK